MNCTDCQRYVIRGTNQIPPKPYICQSCRPKHGLPDKIPTWTGKKWYDLLQWQVKPLRRALDWKLGSQNIKPGSSAEKMLPLWALMELNAYRSTLKQGQGSATFAAAHGSQQSTPPPAPRTQFICSDCGNSVHVDNYKIPSKPYICQPCRQSNGLPYILPTWNSKTWREIGQWSSLAHLLDWEFLHDHTRPGSDKEKALPDWAKLELNNCRMRSNLKPMNKKQPTPKQGGRKVYQSFKCDRCMMEDIAFFYDQIPPLGKYCFKCREHYGLPSALPTYKYDSASWEHCDEWKVFDNLLDWSKALNTVTSASYPHVPDWIREKLDHQMGIASHQSQTASFEESKYDWEGTGCTGCFAAPLPDCPVHGRNVKV